MKTGILWILAVGLNLLVATVVIAANLLTDLAYCIIDPRISYS